MKLEYHGGSAAAGFLAALIWSGVIGWEWLPLALICLINLDGFSRTVWNWLKKP